jgi:hypothetical protein
MDKEIAKRAVEIGTGWRPHAYQKAAVKFMLERGCAGLFLDPG